MKFSLARNKQSDPYSANLLYPNSPLANEQSSCRKFSKQARLHNKSAHINNNITNYGAKQLNSQSFRQFNLDHKTSEANPFGNNKQMKIHKIENKNQQASAETNNLFFCRQNTKRRNKKQFSLKSNEGNYNSTIILNNSRLQRFGYSPPQISTDIPQDIKFKNFISHAYNFKSLENINQNVNKQSFIPSQKTVALNNTHSGLQNTFIYRSRVTTQKGCAFQMTERPVMMKDNMNDFRMVVSPSTPRIRFDYGQIQKGYDSPQPQSNQQQNKTEYPKITIESQRHQTISKSSFEEHLIWNNKDQSNMKNLQNIKIKKILQESQQRYNSLFLQFKQLQNRLKRSEEVNHQLSNRILQFQNCPNERLMPQQLNQSNTKRGENNCTNQTLQKDNSKLPSNDQQNQLGPGHKTAQFFIKKQAKISQYQNVIKENNQKIANLESQLQNLNIQFNKKIQINKKSLNIAHQQIIELREKYQHQAIEKHKEIQNLLQRIDNLNIDVNNKNQIVKKLHKQMIQTDKHKNTYKNTYLSESEQQDKQIKPKLDDLHEHIFNIQCEGMILENKNKNLNDKLKQNGQQLKRITSQNQTLRKQIGKLKNQEHQRYKLHDILNKKDNELKELTDLIIKRNQNFGQYSTLSVQNQKLKEILMKKNQQLSQLTYRLYDNDRSQRQYICLENSLNQKQLQIQRLHSILSNKDIRIEQLHQSYTQMKRNFEQSQSQLKRHKKIAQQNQSLIKSKTLKQQEYEGQIIKIVQINHFYQEEANNLNSKLQNISFQLSKKIESQNKIQKDLEKAQFNVDNINKELQKKIQEKQILKQQKQRYYKQIEQMERRKSELMKDYQQISNKYIETKSSLKNRDSKILYLQQQISFLNQQLKKHNNCSKQIEVLTDKIAAYQLTILKLNMNRPISTAFGPAQSSQSIKDKIIHQLRNQNNILKQDIHLYGKQQIKLEQERQEKSTIHGRSLVQNLGDKNQKSRQKLENKRNKLSSKSMPDVFQDLRKETFPKRRQLNYNNKKIITPQYIEMIYSQQVLFYKQKTCQLQQQINNHIKTNKDLKNILEKVINNKDNAIKQFYKHQQKRYQDQITCLKQQNIRLLQDRNRIMQKVRDYQKKDVIEETTIGLHKSNSIKESGPEMHSDISDHPIVYLKKAMTDYEKDEKGFKSFK